MAEAATWPLSPRPPVDWRPLVSSPAHGSLAHPQAPDRSSAPAPVAPSCIAGHVAVGPSPCKSALLSSTWGSPSPLTSLPHKLLLWAPLPQAPRVPTLQPSAPGPTLPRHGRPGGCGGSHVEIMKWSECPHSSRPEGRRPGLDGVSSPGGHLAFVL